MIKLGIAFLGKKWLYERKMPTIDKLYALSQLLQVPIDEIVCGNRKAILPSGVVLESQQERRIYTYYKKICKLQAA